MLRSTGLLVLLMVAGMMMGLNLHFCVWLIVNGWDLCITICYLEFPPTFSSFEFHYSHCPHIFSSFSSQMKSQVLIISKYSPLKV